jgi:ubiquinone/menaquinone biosynthesis C-methylase UbiE
MPSPAVKLLKGALDTVSYSTLQLPPRALREWVSPTWLDFHKSGRDQLEFFVELAGLQCSDRFLDIACGIGRLAIPLTKFIDSKGSYDGFDIREDIIDWCNRKIAAQRPNFRFTVANVATSWHPERPVSADYYVFPYDDASFDFAYAGSIFTHMLPKGAENYLKQTARVLRPNGRLVATWLVFNQRSMQLTSTEESVKKNWKYDFGDYRVKSEEVPESSVAYDETKIRQMYADAGFEILEPFRSDATYNSARIPNEREAGQHLYYALSIIASRRSDVT